MASAIAQPCGLISLGRICMSKVTFTPSVQAIQTTTSNTRAGGLPRSIWSKRSKNILAIKCDGSTQGSGDLQKGYFKISGDFIYLDKYDHDGKNLLVPMCTKDHGASSAGGIMTIYEIVSNKYKPVQVWQVERSRFGYSEDSRRAVQLEALGGHKPLEGTLTANSIYYITFGGLF